MITVKSNIKVVTGRIKQQLEQLKNKEYLLRPVAIEVIPLITERIHQKGEASDDSQIGTYSSGYMAIRTGVFKSNEVYKSGPNKGKNKPTGKFTRGKNKGLTRPSYNRSNDTKVIVSLTRKLEQDWAVIATPNGYGIGFLNPLSLQKLRWVEGIKDKTIGNLSKSEQQYAVDRINELIADALNS